MWYDIGMYIFEMEGVCSVGGDVLHVAVDTMLGGSSEGQAIGEGFYV